VHNKIDRKHIGPFQEWVKNDVMKEEKDTLEENNLTGKGVQKDISTKAVRWLRETYGV